MRSTESHPSSQPFVGRYRVQEILPDPPFYPSPLLPESDSTPRAPTDPPTGVASRGGGAACWGSQRVTGTSAAPGGGEPWGKRGDGGARAPGGTLELLASLEVLCHHLRDRTPPRPSSEGAWRRAGILFCSLASCSPRVPAALPLLCCRPAAVFWVVHPGEVFGFCHGASGSFTPARCSTSGVGSHERGPHPSHLYQTYVWLMISHQPLFQVQTG